MAAKTNDEVTMPAISAGCAPVASLVCTMGVAELLDHTDVDISPGCAPVASLVCSVGVAEVLDCTSVDTEKIERSGSQTHQNEERLEVINFLVPKHVCTYHCN